MRLIDPPFKLCEEVIDTILHFTTNTSEVELDKVVRTTGKSLPYLKRAIEFLVQINVIKFSDNKLSIIRDRDNYNYIPISLIKKGITSFKPFKEYLKLLQNGRTEKKALQLVKTSFDLNNDDQRIKEIFDKQIKYLESDVPIIPEVKNKVNNIPTEHNFFWIDEDGHLVYDEKAHTEKIVNELEVKRFKNPAFIDQSRIDKLKQIKNPNFDLSKLARICEEINDSYRVANYFSVGVLIRAILDHIPPIFSKKSFAEVANNYGSKSFKDIMGNLENFTRKIADGILHSHIRRKEALPNSTTVDCRAGLDVLLSEIINELQ